MLIENADETVDVYLILRTAYVDGSTLRSYFSRLSITLEAQIVNGPAPDRDGPQAKEVIFTGDVKDIEDPFILVDEADDSDSETAARQHVYAVWKIDVLLARPRMRLQTPSAVFTVSIALKPSEAVDESASNLGYMQSGRPTGLNLLDAFADDPMLCGVKPYLPAQRIFRVAPLVAQDGHLLRPIKAMQSLSLRIFPAMHSRVRYARPNPTPSNPAIIALLEIDFTPFFDCEITIDSINLSLTGGTVTDLNQAATLLELPQPCHVHDHLTFLYRLTPSALPDEQGVRLLPFSSSSGPRTSTAASPTRDLEISIRATAHVRPGVCHPRLTMAWTTQLDFAQPVINPGFGTALPQSLQRSHRPSQLSISGSESLTPSSIMRPDALPQLEASRSPVAVGGVGVKGENTPLGMSSEHAAAAAAAAAMAAPSTAMAIPDFGITVTFTAPREPVHAGDIFVWSVLVVNHSSPDPRPGGAASGTQPQARKLALIALPRRRDGRGPGGPQNRPNSALLASASGTAQQPGPYGAPRPPASSPVADAVADENVLHLAQRLAAAAIEASDLVCLSADVRVGPLAPGACHEVELRFVALREGIVSLEAVRVVDLGSQEHVDVRDLPLVVVTTRKDEKAR